MNCFLWSPKPAPAVYWWYWSTLLYFLAADGQVEASHPARQATIPPSKDETAIIPCPKGCSCRNDWKKSIECKSIGWTELPKFPPNVQHLIITGNSIRRLSRESGLYNLPRLRDFTFDNNGLKRVEEGTFPPWVRMVSLDGNLLTKISATAFRETNIKTLHIAHNKIRLVRNDAFPLGLEFLNISGNRLDRVKKGFLDYLPNLVYLYLYNNKIDTIEHHALPSSLRTLGLGFNKLQRLGNELSNLRMLKNLFLNNNGMKSLGHNAFHHLRELCELSLMKNQLTEFHPEQFALLHNLTTLNIFKNKIRRLPKSALPLNYKLTRLYLQQNPYHCDCSVRWLADLMRDYTSVDYTSHFHDNYMSGKRKKEDPPAPESIFCSSPPAFQNCPLVTIDFDCPLMNCSGNARYDGPWEPSTLSPIFTDTCGPQHQQVIAAASGSLLPPPTTATTTIRSSSSQSSTNPTQLHDDTAWSTNTVSMQERGASRGSSSSSAPSNNPVGHQSAASLLLCAWLLAVLLESNLL
eukprot:scpid47111/ scgid3998/ Leucine-rich repeat-containing protein 4; Netrin-G2 ligand